MGISVTKFKLTQSVTPLKVGDNVLTIQFDGMVDGADDNDIQVSGSIEPSAPIKFKKTGTKEISLPPMKFGIGVKKSFKETLTVVLATPSPIPTDATITFVFKSAKGNTRTAKGKVIF